MLEYWSTGVLEYWSIGVLDETRTEQYESCSSAHLDMIICTVKEIGQKQFRVVLAYHFDDT